MGAARVVLEGLTSQLEEIAAKGSPLSLADEVCSWRTLLAASQILSQMSSEAMADDVVTRLRAAVDQIEALTHKERTLWIN